MTRRLHRLATPNDDLAVDRTRRVYKLRRGVWHRIDYVLPAGALMLAGKAPAQTVEVGS